MQATGVRPGSGGLREALRRARPALPYLGFLAAWGLLDATVNVRFPGRETALWYLIPSLDVVVLLAGFALLGWRGARVPAAARWVLVAGLVFVRLFRIADGIETRFLFRTFNLWVDSQLAPELWRTLYASMPRAKLFAATAAVLGAIVVLVLLVNGALRFSERFLRERRRAVFFAAVVALFAALSPLVRASDHPEHYRGAFAASVVPRLLEEADFILHVHGYRVERLAQMNRMRAELVNGPRDLERLGGANVLLFVIESYGVTVWERPLFVERLLPVYRRFEAELGQAGFTTASAVLDSPTYGGGSWLAHATLATGVRAADQFQHALLGEEKPPTLAGFFRAAGYRTVLVQPATRRELPHKEFHGFEHRYYSSAFDYRGPRFGFAPMPDQYVIDFLHRRELAARPERCFVEYALVSSHLPWAEHAPLIDDWAAIGDGAIYGRLPKVRHAAEWHDLSEAAHGYAFSIEYDLEVLRRYLVERVAGGALVIILGDHQPVSEVTLNSPDHGVPIHVVSRRRDFVDAFVARGYRPGLRPDLKAPRAGLEHFMPGFLRDFSRP
jgi:hypothetical protein